MEISSLEVAVIYKKAYKGNAYYVMTYLPTKEAAEKYLEEYEKGSKKIESDYKIVMEPLFDVLNDLLHKNSYLEERIEILEEKI